MTTPVKAAYPSLLKEYQTQFSMEKYGFFRITDVKFGVSSTKLTIKNKKAKYTKRRNIAD